MFSHTLAEMSYYNPNSSIVEKISVILFDGTAEDPYLSNAYSVYLEKSSSRHTTAPLAAALSHL